MDTQRQRAEGSATGSPGHRGTATSPQMREAGTPMKISFPIIRKCFASLCPAQNNHVKNICDQRTIKDLRGHGQGQGGKR